MSLLQIFFICQIFLFDNVLCFHLLESDLQINSFAGPQNPKIFKNDSHLQTSTTVRHHKPIQQDAAVKDRPQNETILGDDVENQSHQHHQHLPYTTQPQYQLKYENNFKKYDANANTTKLLSSTLFQKQQLRQQQKHLKTFEQQQQKQGNQNVIETPITTIIIQNGVNQPHNLEKHQQLTVNQAIIKQQQQQQQQHHQYQQLFLSDFKLLNAANCRNKRQTQQIGYNNGGNNNNNNEDNKNDNNNDNDDNVNANVNANGNQQQLYTTYSIQYYPYQQQQQQQSLPYEMQQQHPQYQLQYYQQTSQNLQKNYNNNAQLIGNGNSLSIHPSSLPSLSASTVDSIYTSTLALPAINMQHKQQQQQQQQSAPQKSLPTLPLPLPLLLPTFLATTKSPPPTRTTTAASTLVSFQPLLPLDIINEYEKDNVNDDSNTSVCTMCCNPMELQPPNCTKCCSPLLHVQTLKTLGG